MNSVFQMGKPTIKTHTYSYTNNSREDKLHEYECIRVEMEVVVLALRTWPAA